MLKIIMTQVLSLSLISMPTLAAESKIVTIEGKIRSFDSKSVRVSTDKGVLEVPRTFIASDVQLKTDDRIKIPLTEVQLTQIK